MHLVLHGCNMSASIDSYDTQHEVVCRETVVHASRQLGMDTLQRTHVTCVLMVDMQVVMTAQD